MKPSVIISKIAFAALLFCHAVQAQSTNPLEEALAAIKARDLAKASALLEPLTGAAATDAAAFHTLSVVRLAQKNTVEAITLAEKATALDATNAEYFTQLGMALGNRMGEVGFMQKAMLAGKLKRAFEKAVALDPNNLGGLIGLTRYYANAPEIAGGSLKKATELATRVQRLEPFLGELELGNVMEQGESYETALSHFEAAAKLRPGNVQVENACGRLLAKLGRKDEARARFQAALKVDPTDSAAAKSLAELDAPAE